MKKFSIVLLTSTALFIGCGGSSSDDSTTTDTTRSITASDAYVVKLNTPATAVCGDKSYASTTVNDGNISFNFDADTNISECKFYIPNDAIVDTDGDGNYSAGDLPIRMALRLQGEGVANPLTTAAIEQNNSTDLDMLKNFDPVKAKAALLLNPNDEVNKTLVAVADSIADTVKNAQENNISTTEILKNMNLETVRNAIKNPTDLNTTEIVDQTITPAITGTSLQLKKDEILQKVDDEMKNIEDLHNHIKDNNISHDDALKLVLMQSDGDSNITDINKLNKDQLEELLDSKTKELEEKHNEMLPHINMPQNSDMESNYSDDDINASDALNQFVQEKTQETKEKIEDAYKNGTIDKANKDALEELLDNDK